VQVDHHRGQQVERDHGRFRKVGLEDVLHVERRTVGKPQALRLGVALLDEVRIDVDAEAARLVFAGGGQDDHAIARAEVDHEIPGSHLTHAQHLVDDDLRRGHIRPAGALELFLRGGDRPHAKHRKTH